MVALVCPDCRQILKEHKASFICAQCNTNYSVTNGIVCFNDLEHYYGEIKRNEMQQLLNLAERSGWYRAVITYLPEINPSLIPTITDPRRISWVSLLDLQKAEVALDLGCGLGGVSARLTGHVNEVIAVDGCFDRIRFLQIRKDQERLNNLSLVCTGNICKLPFQESSFDLVVMNMVFPYFWVTLPQYTKHTAETILMKQIIKTIKPGGQLYMSVRNRDSLHRYRDMIVRRSVHPDADNFHIQNIRYYRDLLAKSGMNEIQAFLPIPNYKYPEYLLPLDENPSAVKEYLCKAAERSHLIRIAGGVACRLGLLEYLAETCAIVARKRVNVG